MKLFILVCLIHSFIFNHNVVNAGETVVYNDHLVISETNVKPTLYAPSHYHEEDIIPPVKTEIFDPSYSHSDSNRSPEKQASLLELNTVIRLTNSDVQLSDIATGYTESAEAGKVFLDAADYAGQILDTDEELEKPSVAVALAKTTAINEICATAALSTNFASSISGRVEFSSGFVKRVFNADVKGKAVAIAQAVAEAVARVERGNRVSFAKAKIDALAEDIELAVVQANIEKHFHISGESSINDQDQREGEASKCALAIADVVAEAIAALLSVGAGSRGVADVNTDVSGDGTSIQVQEDNMIVVQDLTKRLNSKNLNKQEVPELSPELTVLSSSAQDPAFITPAKQQRIIVNNEEV
eukprot:TRINITY_DN35285_c0_g1_i1.p1 TRINITY_DN35285_c0_g1~~TRINITY_DN35285_c0_g1_i1.p1  ORF type:complete len:357 (-),score=49.17 TRINITY_DN35285_c0_g1_i1:227-1297(-)